MFIQKLFFLSIVLSLLLSAKPYNQKSQNTTRNIKVKIKKKFHIPKKIDHRNILKQNQKRLKKIKKDRGSIVKAH
ncbi:MAG: hypothetical protein U9N49_02570 [Campylobacterota bacterium]|nr:hypothetical protein [Campylobacterota bacterium]